MKDGPNLPSQDEAVGERGESTLLSQDSGTLSGSARKDQEARH